MKKILASVLMSAVLIGVSVTPAEAAKAGQFCSQYSVGNKVSASNGGKIICKKFSPSGKKAYYKWVKIVEPIKGLPIITPTPTPTPTPPPMVVPVAPPAPRLVEVAIGDTCTLPVIESKYISTSGDPVICVWSGALKSKTTGDISYVDRQSMDGNFNGYYNTYGDVPYYALGSTYSKYQFTGYVWANAKYKFICDINAERYPLGEAKKAAYGCGTSGVYVSPHFDRNGIPRVWKNEICKASALGYEAIVVDYKDSYRANPRYFETATWHIGECTKVADSLYSWR